MSYTKFVIVSQPRSGSTLLHMRLLSHPHVVAYGELFHPSIETRKHNLKGSKRPLVTVKDDPVEYLETYIYKKYPKIKAIGFKLFYDHAQNDEWKHLWNYLRASQVKVIHLKRRNLLDRYLSFELAMRSNIWINLENKQGISYDPIWLDPEKCLKDFYRTEKLEQETAEFFKDSPKLSIVYEELVARPDREARRLLNFLGLEYQRLTSKTKKQLSKRQSDVIANYDRLKEQVFAEIARDRAREEWADFFKD